MQKTVPTFVALLAVFCAADSVGAAVLEVGSGQAYGTIQTAVDAANDGDTIEVHSGTYHETVNVNKANLTIEAFDAGDPPEIDGADQDFANSAHTWVQVQGKIFKTPYQFPYPHITPEQFMDWDRSQPKITVYEDDIWLRGYWGGNWNEVSRPYNSLSDLDPSNDSASPSNREIRIAGRFMYDDSAKELYVWTAKEHGEDHPSNHRYNIPILKSLIVIDAPGVTIRNLVLKHSYYYPIDIKSGRSGSTIENNFIINTGPFAIVNMNAKDTVIRKNFIQNRGFYERQDYMSVRHNLQYNFFVQIRGYGNASGCRISENVMSGNNGIMVGGKDCEVHDNILSGSPVVMIFSSPMNDNPPEGNALNTKIYRNILHDSEGEGFTAYNTFDASTNKYYGPTYFYRNVLYGVRFFIKDGCNASPCDATPDVFAYNNTFVLGSLIDHTPYKYPNRKTTVYRNNIFHLRYTYMEMYWSYGGKDPAKGWSYFPFDNGPDSDNNLFWRDDAHDWPVISRFYHLDVDARKDYKRGEFPLMQDETGLDTNSHESDPRFVDGNISTADVFSLDYDNFSTMHYSDIISSGYDSLFVARFYGLYHAFDVQADSPAIDKGVAIPGAWPDTVTVLDGKPDIGAVEYGGGVDTVAPAAPSGLLVR